MAQPNGGYPLSRHRDPKNFTKAQLQQHKQWGNQIQRANALAAQALLTLRRFRPGQKRYECVCTDLATAVCRMNFLIGCCEQIALSGFRKQFSRINVILGTTCEHCEETGRSADRNSNQGDIGTLEADPAWGVLVEFLLFEVTLAIHRIVGGECSSLSEFEEFPVGLHDLTKALLRQRRHLARMGSARAPEIVVTYDDAEVCSECGHPTGGPLGDDGDDACSP
jgi:hypothetical protein